jgi:hypothetical protein
VAASRLSRHEHGTAAGAENKRLAVGAVCISGLNAPSTRRPRTPFLLFYFDGQYTGS